MKDNQIKKETIDLCKKFITAWFLELRKTWEYERYRKYMFWKNIPEFLSKYFERAGEKLEFDERVQNIIQTTWATEKEIKQVLQNGYTITECLSLFSKKL
jgi:hypothetical protein